MSRLYPAMLRLEGRSCVVVGGGTVATRKVAGLLEAGAVVAVVAPRVSPELEAIAARGALRLERRPYRAGDLAGAWLAFAATDSPSVNAAVGADARSLGIPANLADDPVGSTFQVPAIVERDGLTLAVSTGGRSPAFARRLREELEAILSAERVALLELYAELRVSLGVHGRSAPGAAWAAADEQALELLRAGRAREARAVLERQVLATAAGAG